MLYQIMCHEHIFEPLRFFEQCHASTLCRLPDACVRLVCGHKGGRARLRNLDEPEKGRTLDAAGKDRAGERRAVLESGAVLRRNVSEPVL